MKNVLDDFFLSKEKCERKKCSTDEELKNYPMINEDDFDRVGENLAFCSQCNNRMNELSTLFNKKMVTKNINLK